MYLSSVTWNELKSWTLITQDHFVVRLSASYHRNSYQVDITYLPWSLIPIIKENENFHFYRFWKLKTDWEVPVV